MKYITEGDLYVKGRCEKCRREIEVPRSNITPGSNAFDIKVPVKCDCGNIHNLILGNANTKKWANEKVKFDPDYSPPQKNNTVSCPRCGSTQFYAGDKGFSLGSAAAGGIIFGIVGLLTGFIGSKQIIITCLNCGHTWKPG